MYPKMEKKRPTRPRKKLKKELLDMEVDMEEFPPIPNVRDVLSKEEIEKMEKYFFYQNKQMADLFYTG